MTLTGITTASVSQKKKIVVNILDSLQNTSYLTLILLVLTS